MNKIVILEPRWHDNVVLIMDSRLMSENEIVINHRDFPTPFYLSAKKAREFPLKPMKTKSGREVMMREVPLSELEKEEITI